MIRINQRNLKDIVSKEVDEVRNIIFDQNLKNIILEKCKNGTLHIKTQDEVKRYI